MSFIFYVILQFILYSIFIFLVHTVFHYIKDNYTTKKEVNLVKIQQEQYKDMMKHLDKIKYQENPGPDPDQMILYGMPQPYQDTRFLEDSLIDVLIQEGGL